MLLVSVATYFSDDRHYKMRLIPSLICILALITPDASGQRYAIFEAYAPTYFRDKTSGLAFSPDGTKMYTCFQDCGCEVSGDVDCGCMLEFERLDGRSFDGETLNLRF